MRAIRAIASSLLLAALLVGLPLVLALGLGWPLPTHLPTMASLQDWAANPLSSLDLVRIIAVVAWVVWAHFTLCVLVELVTVLRHLPEIRQAGAVYATHVIDTLPMPSIPMGSLSQDLARRLICAVLLGTTAIGGVTTTALAASNAPVSTTSVATDPSSSAVAPTTNAPQQKTSSQPTKQSAAPTYVVRRGDCLWDIAESRLGDGQRWNEIYDLNRSTVQDPDLLEIGQTLRMPATQVTGQSSTVSSASNGPSVYTVVAGDDLATIAERHWGDWQSYPALLAVNESVLHGSAYLEPGMQLQLPKNRPALATHTVAAGDNLADLAELHLGDYKRFTQIRDLNHDLLHGSNYVDVGMVLQLPTLADGSDSRSSTPSKPSAAASQASKLPAPTPTSVPTQTRTVPTPSETNSAPVVTSSPAASATKEGRSARPATASAPTGAPGPLTRTASDSDSPWTPTVLTGFGSLGAAAVLIAIAAARRRQQSRRPSGARIPMPQGKPAATESRLRVGEYPAGLEWVDAALRLLDAQMAKQGRDVPDLVLATLSSETLTLQFSGPVDEPPTPWYTSTRTIWALATTTDLDQVARDANAPDVMTTPPPYPCLVTLGHDEAGNHVLVDLEHGPTLSITGADDETAGPVLAALAVEIAASPWSRDLSLNIVGGLADLVAAMPDRTIRHFTQLREVLPELTARDDDIRADVNATNVAESHDQDPPFDWCPEVVVVLDSLAEDETAEARALLQRLPIALAMVTGDGTDLGGLTLTPDDESDQWRLNDSSTGIAMQVQPQMLTAEECEHVITVLTTAHKTPMPSPDANPDPEPSFADLVQIRVTKSSAPNGPSDVPRIGEDTIDLRDSADDTEPKIVADELESRVEEPVGTVSALHTGPVVKVLGPVKVQGARGPDQTNRTPKLTELATFMALHPGSDTSTLTEALWPGGTEESRRSTRAPAITRLRTWLGTDDDKNPFLMRWTRADGYRLSPNVRCDWNDFCNLVPVGKHTTADLSELKASVRLVRGRPFAGSAHWPWAEVDRQELTSHVVDVIHELANRALCSGDYLTARTSAETGLKVTPEDERFWRTLIRIDYAMNNLSGVRDRAAALARQLHTLGWGMTMDEETAELLDQILGPQAVHA